ncbi:hypothetical protein Ddc_16062 [Ditylenchus destructor]|nr:hypothetical protein Ddc_16062 [Ditylenchus destructor]
MMHTLIGGNSRGIARKQHWDERKLSLGCIFAADAFMLGRFFAWDDSLPIDQRWLKVGGNSRGATLKRAHRIFGTNPGSCVKCDIFGLSKEDREIDQNQADERRRKADQKFPIFGTERRKIA